MWYDQRIRPLVKMVASRLRRNALDRTRKGMQKQAHCKITPKWAVKENEPELAAVNMANRASTPYRRRTRSMTWNLDQTSNPVMIESKQLVKTCHVKVLRATLALKFEASKVVQAFEPCLLITPVDSLCLWSTTMMMRKIKVTTRMTHKSPRL